MLTSHHSRFPSRAVVESYLCNSDAPLICASFASFSGGPVLAVAIGMSGTYSKGLSTQGRYVGIYYWTSAKRIFGICVNERIR